LSVLMTMLVPLENEPAHLPAINQSISKTTRRYIIYCTNSKCWASRKVFEMPGARILLRNLKSSVAISRCSVGEWQTGVDGDVGEEGRVWEGLL
jgi:hypothetical protein